MCQLRVVFGKWWFSKTWHHPHKTKKYGRPVWMKSHKVTKSSRFCKIPFSVFVFSNATLTFAAHAVIWRRKLKYTLNKETTEGSVRTYCLKHSVLCAVAFPRNNSCSSNQPCCQVINNVAIQVGHNQHIKLVRILDQLQQKEQWDYTRD